MTDHMSHYPLPEKGNDRLEKYAIASVRAEHAVVMEKIKAETESDEQLQKLRVAIETGKWDKTDPDLKPYYDI